MTSTLSRLARAAVNSSPGLLALWEQATVSGPINRCDIGEKPVERRAAARGHDIGGTRRQRSRFARCGSCTGAPATRAASRRKAHLRASASTSSTPRHAHDRQHQPGKPGAAAEIDQAAARRPESAAEAAPNRGNAGATDRPSVLAADQVDAPPTSAPAARHRPRAAPVFHVKHRSARRSRPASSGAAQAARGSGRRLTYCSSATSAAGVTPEMRAAAPKVAGRAAASLPRISADRLPTAA